MSTVIEDINGEPLTNYTLEQLQEFVAALNTYITEYVPDTAEETAEKKMQRTYEQYLGAVKYNIGARTLGFADISYDKFRTHLLTSRIPDSADSHRYNWEFWFDREFEERQAAWRKGATF